MANGDILWREAQCPNYHYLTQGHQFSSNFRVLPLKGYDLILGADWIYTHSVKTREFKIIKNGVQEITFTDETLPKKICFIGTKQLQKLLDKGVSGAVVYARTLKVNTPETTLAVQEIQPVLDQFADIFEEPIELPPHS